MNWFFQAIATGTDLASSALFSAMDLAYKAGGGSLLPALLGTIVVTASGALLALS